MYPLTRFEAVKIQCLRARIESFVTRLEEEVGGGRMFRRAQCESAQTRFGDVQVSRMREKYNVLRNQSESSLTRFGEMGLRSFLRSGGIALNSFRWRESFECGEEYNVYALNANQS